MEIKNKLAQLHIHPCKKRGQNFLFDSKLIEKISNCILASGLDRMFEIGPGLGAITSEISKSLKSSHYCAIEIDNLLYQHLNQQRYNCQFILGDCLKVNWSELFPNQQFLTFGNLPYSISTSILMKWVNTLNTNVAIFMFQKEVAERIMSAPSKKTYGSLSVISQLQCDITRLLDVPRDYFYPEPGVNSVLLKFVKKKIVSQDLQNFIKNCFIYKRKTITNNLKKYYDDKKIITALRACGLDVKSRAEQLIASTFLILYANLRNNL